MMFSSLGSLFGGTCSHQAQYLAYQAQQRMENEQRLQKIFAEEYVRFQVSWVAFGRKDFFNSLGPNSAITRIAGCE